MERAPNTEYVLSLSYGKDSLACLGAIKELGLPLDRIVHAEIWATDTIPADLPPMVEFKKKADQIILDRYGIEVEHICATRSRVRESYEKVFYKRFYSKKYKREQIYGFPRTGEAWCNACLKLPAIKQSEKCIQEEVLQSPSPCTKKNTVRYIGIAADENERIKKNSKPNVILPLVLAKWNEAYCRQWCEENNLLSPIYSSFMRGGCWFCHNQTIEQLRFLRRNYPEYWELLLKWDKDSPTSFKPNGRKVRDFDKRFQYEDEGKIPTDRKFRWKMLDKIDSNIIQD